MTREERDALLTKAQSGDQAARAQMVEENLGLIHSIVRRFIGRGCDPEDLFQIGSIGLLKAIDKFDRSFEVQFSTYAVPLIVGEIKRFLRDDGMIKVSRSLKETAVKARLTMQQLQGSLGREPTMDEVSAQMGITGEELAVALEAGAEVESLSKTIYQRDGSEISLLEKLDDGENHCDQVLDRVWLQQLLRELPRQQRQVIFLRYFGEQTQTQVARRLGMTQVQVSRMEKRILARLRQKADGG